MATSPGTAQRLFTHRHTIYYRLERVRELSGLDVSSSDGREKLSLGLKSMRVLGIASAGGPATEAGAGGGRVPRRSDGRRRVVRTQAYVVRRAPREDRGATRARIAVGPQHDWR